ncbi:MAG: RimK/LysX family protein [Bdellovibrionales bacterium]
MSILKNNNVKKTKQIEKKVIGWREKAALPALGVKSIKVKVDSGAKTSALHASRVKIFTENGKQRVRFRLHPRQNEKEKWVWAEEDLVEKRLVKSSTGTTTLRPVIRTKITLAGRTYPIEVTLVNRDMMGFRMLLGREGFRKYFLVDAAKSFLGDK